MQARLVVLDTETTGLEVEQGHRIVEVACVEIIGRKVTGRHFREYVNPQREIDAGALGIHGISSEELADKPVFADICDSFLAFIKDSELVIHNASFDVGFIEAEMARIGAQPPRLADHCAKITDSLAEARSLRRGKKNSLDALCKEYGVDASRRDYHGALLDAELLAEVYLALTSGQDEMNLAGDDPAPLQASAPSSAPAQPQALAPAKDRPPLKVIKATPEELAAHEARLAALDKASAGHCLWRQP